MPATRTAGTSRGAPPPPEPPDVVSSNFYTSVSNFNPSANPLLTVSSSSAVDEEEEHIQKETLIGNNPIRGHKKARSLGWQKDNRPPRPSNAFISFKSSLKDGPLKREYARRLASGENIGVVAQQMWKALSEQERETWYAEARRAKEEHAKKYPGYKYRPRRRGETSKGKKRASQATAIVGEDDELEEDSEEVEQPANEEAATTVRTPASTRSEDVGDMQGETRTVEVYMGGNQNLDVLYKNGWKWALIRDLQNPDTPRDELPNPVLHLSTPTSTLDPALGVDLVQMSSVMSHTEPEISAPFDSNNDPVVYQQNVTPWEVPPPSNLFLHDLPLSQELSFTESMLKVPGMADTSL